MTRAEMRRAAFALHELADGWGNKDVSFAHAAEAHGIDVNEINGWSPRIRWLIKHERRSPMHAHGCRIEASLLMSEAEAPEWGIAP